MRSFALSVIGLLGTMIYQTMPSQDLVPQPQRSVLTAQRGDLSFDLPSTTQEVKEIEAEVKEIAPQLGATANSELLQSISVLSLQIGQMHSDMVTTDKVDSMITERTGHLVAFSAMTEAIDEVKEQLKTAASDCDCKCEEKLAEIFKRLDALEAKCGIGNLGTAQPAVTATSQYGSYGTSYAPMVAGSTGCTGSKVSYSQPVVTSSYEVASPVVVSSGGCTGSLSYSQPVYGSSYAPAAQVVVPQETREVRIVEPRQPRRVSTAEIPATSWPAVGFADQSTCDMSDPNSECAKAARAAAMQAQPVQAQPRQRLGSRLFGR